VGQLENEMGPIIDGMGLLRESPLANRAQPKFSWFTDVGNFRNADANVCSLIYIANV
jgi:hypothetical protein